MNIECVILAAGLSSRCNTNKLLLKIGNKTVIEHCIKAFYHTCSRIIVVTGHYHNDICKVLKSYDKVNIVYNEDYQEGMFSSVKVGVSEIKSDRFFITPGDYPLLKKNTIKELVNIDAEFVSPTYNGISGHPILLKKNIIPEILSRKYITLRECLKDIKSISKEVDDRGIISDIDYIEDYYKIKKVLS